MCSRVLTLITCNCDYVIGHNIADSGQWSADSGQYDMSATGE